jgi:hypothetical protein
MADLGHPRCKESTSITIFPNIWLFSRFSRPRRTKPNRNLLKILACASGKCRLIRLEYDPEPG